MASFCDFPLKPQKKVEPYQEARLREKRSSHNRKECQHCGFVTDDIGRFYCEICGKEFDD